jgi:hypothetical protein
MRYIFYCNTILKNQGAGMDYKQSFNKRAEQNLRSALGELQNGKMACEGLDCPECYFYSGSNPAGLRCEIVNVEIKICCLLKSMEKGVY